MRRTDTVWKTEAYAATWRWMAAAMIAATLIVACGDDSEQTSPLAPSAVPQSGMHPASMNDARGDNGVSQGPNRTDGTAQGNANRASGMASNGAHEDVADNGLGSEAGPPPPGMSMAQLKQMVESRNAREPSMIRQAVGPRPSRVRNFSVDAVSSAENIRSRWTRPAQGTSGNTRYEIEWERLDGGRCYNDQTAPPDRDCNENLYRDRDSNIYAFDGATYDNGYYVFWIRAYGSGRSGPWTAAWVNVDKSEPEPEPVPIPNSFNEDKGNWDCSGTQCVQTVTITASNSAGDTSFDYRWRTDSSDWTTVNAAQALSRNWAPGYYYYEARAISGSRKSEWSSQHHVRVRPTRSDYQNNGSVPSQPREVVMTKLEDCDDPPDGGRYNCEWNLSWNGPNSAGGWEIERFYYSDTGPALNEQNPGRECGDSSWPAWRATPEQATNARQGREYGVDVRVNMPNSNWRLSISAVSGKGESPCVAGSR